MLHVSWTPRMMNCVHTGSFHWSYSHRIRGSLPTGGSWVPPEQMPSWVTPVAFVILIAVYALIVFELVHRALAAAWVGSQ